MGYSINKVCLLGNVGNEPDIRFMQNGDCVANLSVATNEKWSDKQTGEKKEHVEWHKVVVFGKLAEIIRDYVKKGSKIYIEGQNKTRKWVDQSNVERYSTEVVVTQFKGDIVLLDGSGNAQQGYQQTPHQQAKQNGYQPQQQPFDSAGVENETFDESDIPF